MNNYDIGVDYDPTDGWLVTIRSDYRSRSEGFEESGPDVNVLLGHAADYIKDEVSK